MYDTIILFYRMDADPTKCIIVKREDSRMDAFYHYIWSTYDLAALPPLNFKPNTGFIYPLMCSVDGA